MFKFAFFNLPARGHLNPTLPIVKELVAGGAEVHYFITEEYRGPVESVGGIFHPLPPLTRIGEQKSEFGSAPDDKQIALMPFAMAYQAPQVIPQLVQAIQAIKPACLVHNTLSLWPRLAASILQLPSVGFRPFHGPRLRRSVVAPFASERLARLAVATNRGLAALMSSFGRPPVELEDLASQDEELTLMFLPKELQYEADAFDERFLFVGPSFFQDEIKPWPFRRNDFDPPRLRGYISLGTLRNNDSDFYRMCFSAFTPDVWDVVMPVGYQIELDSLGPAPQNFLVARYVDQTSVLSQADVFVTHGGLNSVTESLCNGVPMVVIPSIKEQQLTARRVEAIGCGLVLDRKSLTLTTLQESVSLLLADAAIKSHLGFMRERIAASGGYRCASEALFRFAHERS
jgi:MGT family glycosyltransferase